MEAARAILEFAANRSEQELEQDALFQSAVLYQLCIIGEAANHVSDAIKIKYPLVPWVSLNRFRNRIAHEYFSIQLEVVWRTISTEISSVVKEIENIIATEFPS